MPSALIPSSALPHRLAAVVAFATLTALAGCHSTALRTSNHAPLAASGNASFEIVSEESNASGSPAEEAASEEVGFQIVPIAAYVHSPSAKPIYPPEALQGNAGTVVLYLTATFDPTGRLVDLQRSMHRVVLPHPFESAFFAAAKTAIEQWEVDPAREVTWRIPAQGREHQYVRTEAVSTTLEIKFTFHESGQIH